MAKVTEIVMDTKYSALRALITILYILATLLIVFGIIGVFTAFSSNTTSENGFVLLALAPVVISFILAFNFVVMAQIISVFIDMEWNQRETNELLQQVILNLPEQGK